MKDDNCTRRDVLLAGVGALVTQFAVSEDAAAQDPTKVMPRAYRIAFENEHVRVLDFVGRPGMGICGEAMHSHPAHLTIVLSDWQGKASTPDGPEQPRQRKFGNVFWSEAETHKVENTGKANSRVLIVELKSLPKGKA